VNSAPGGGAPFDGRWERSGQQPGSRRKPDPVVADAFRFAPVLVGGEVWLLLAAEMPVEGW
jgi:hypothetical protein